MKAYVSHLKTPSSITITWSEGSPTTIHSRNKNFKKINKLLFQEKYSKIIQLVEGKRQAATAIVAGTNMKVVEGQVIYKDEALPSAMTKKILEFADAKKDVKFIEKFWDKLRRNPDKRSVQTLYSYLDANNVPITPDGNFITYKKVKKDFKDGYTGKYDYSPGNVVRMDRGECDPNPNNTCSNGLHVAAHKYANDFSGDVLVTCEVDPKDVVAVPPDYNNQKMRVCRLRVLKVHGKKKEIKTPTYERKRRGPKRGFSIIRIPRELSYVSPNGKGSIMVPNSILEKFNVHTGDTFYGVARKGKIVLYMSQDDIPTIDKSKAAEFRAGLNHGNVSTKLRDESGIGKRRSYKISATKGTLEITAR